MVIWLIGMSASGKTTIAQEMIKVLRRDNGKSWVLIDGDAFRNIMAEDLGHSVPARKKNADRLCALCAFFESQGINVLACVLSIFHESQDWLRDNIKDYKQVYLKVDYKILKERDNKQLYKRAERGEIEDVVGVQIPFPEPKKSDFILVNDKNDVSPTELAQRVLQGLKIVSPALKYSYTENDLLKNPIKYEYLPFEGIEFLKAYRDDRLQALARLKDREEGWERGIIWQRELKVSSECDQLSTFLLQPLLGRLPGEDEKWLSLVSNELLPEGYNQHFFHGVSVKDCLITREYLIHELSDIQSLKWDYSQRREQLFTLLLRFEVSKKIFTHYSLPDIRKVRRDYADLLNFPLFHTLLTEAHRFADEKGRLALENGILKMGDLLISIIPKLTSSAQLALSHASLHKELKIMEATYGI